VKVLHFRLDMEPTMMTKQEAQPRLHRHTLMEMNLAVFTARRDAAFAQLKHLTRNIRPKGTHQQRIRFYGTCLGLAQDALMATRRSQVQDAGVLIHYFTLLRDMVKAQLALLTHETTLAQESRAFLRLLGRRTMAELRSATMAFSTGEKNVFHAIDDLLDLGEPILEKDTKQRWKRFSDDDQRRYQIALKEFSAYYPLLLA